MMLQSLDLKPNLTLNNNIKVNAAITSQGLLFVSDQINDPCCDDETKFTILHFACSIWHKEVVKLLLSLFGDKNYFEHDYEYDTNFDYVGSNNTYKSLINVNAQDKSKRTPLHLAVFNQKVDIVKIKQLFFFISYL